MANYFEQYDSSDPKSIEEYAKKLIGHSFKEIALFDHVEMHEDDIVETSYGQKTRKGGLGNFLEEQYFGYRANSVSKADFEEAGVELKVSPFEKNNDGSMRAGERLVLSMIGYDKPIEDYFYDSHVWEKCKLILLIYYLRDRNVLNNLDYVIHFAELFTPPEEDLKIIEQDYDTIRRKIQAGKAHELSESDTLYLGACTKGANAEKSTVPQFYGERIPARKRAFCYKRSYMTYVLNNYLSNDSFNNRHDEQIVKNAAELEYSSFEKIIEDKINSYIGKSDKELCSLFDRQYNNNKAQWFDLTYRMLGITSNNAEEFSKANIRVRVIRLEENNHMRESISFPPFKYKELIQEQWENSTLHDYFDQTKFLFVVFKKKSDCYVLRGCQFWNMPYEDLNNEVRNGWQKVVDTIKQGVVFNFKDTKSGIIVQNNFPKKADNRIIHIRPHARKRYFEFSNGMIIGDGNRSDANQLPDGTWMPHYSFWINNDYILEQIGVEKK